MVRRDHKTNGLELKPDAVCSMVLPMSNERMVDRSAAERYGLLAVATALLMLSLWLAARMKPMRYWYPIARAAGVLFGELFVGAFWDIF